MRPARAGDLPVRATMQRVHLSGCDGAEWIVVRAIIGTE